jgi:hypothetical protein
MKQKAILGAILSLVVCSSLILVHTGKLHSQDSPKAPLHVAPDLSHMISPQAVKAAFTDDQFAQNEIIIKLKSSAPEISLVQDGAGYAKTGLSSLDELLKQFRVKCVIRPKLSQGLSYDALGSFQQ